MIEDVNMHLEGSLLLLLLVKLQSLRYDVGMQDALVQKAKTIVCSYLPKGNYQVFLFGSRATDRHHRYSDIDIGIEGKDSVPQSVMAQITGELEESDLPVQVDVVDFSRVSSEFKNVANKTRVAL